MPNINFDIKLLEWQSAVLTNLNNYPHATHVIKARRQVGKSCLLNLIVLARALSEARQRIYFVCPSYKQCAKLLQEFELQVGNAPFVQRMNRQDLQITFSNGSFITFLSAESDVAKLQGYVADLLVFDEASYISDDVYQACLPFTNTTNAPIICCSTPRWQSGFFYELFNDGNDPSVENVISVDVNDYEEDLKKMLSEEKLERYRKTLPKVRFMNYYLGEFASAEGSVFTNIHECIGNSTPLDFKMPVWVGVDWGSGSGGDSTVFTAINERGVVLEIMAFNDKTANETIASLMKFIMKFDVQRLIVETNGVGNVYLSLLREAVRGSGVQIEEFVTSNARKLEEVERLQVALENKQITLLNNAELIKQLSIYERTISKDGFQKFNAPTGSHDDFVISLMLANRGFQRRGKKGTSVNTEGVVVRPWHKRRYI